MSDETVGAILVLVAYTLGCLSTAFVLFMGSRRNR